MRCLSSTPTFFGMSVSVISEDKIGVKPLPSSGKSPKMGTAVTRPLVLSAYRYGKSVPKSQKTRFGIIIAHNIAQIIVAAVPQTSLLP